MDTTEFSQPQETQDQAQQPSVIADEREQSVSLTPAQGAAALAQAKDTHRLVIEWVRALDFKISPLLSATGALVAACLATLGQETTLLNTRPITHILLAVTFLPLLYSLLMAISANSPSLKVSRWGTNRHLPERPLSKPMSVLFFGQIAQHQNSEAYAEAAKAEFLNETRLMDDLLNQTYLNAKIAQAKSVHIALATRGLFFAVILLVICAVTFTLKL